MALDGADVSQPPLMVFLFSSPLTRTVAHGKDTRTIASSQLDATAELKELHQWLSDSAKIVRLRKVAATPKHLEEATREPIRAIHFLGHGDIEGYLMLEDDDGGTNMTKSTRLARLLHCSPDASPSSGSRPAGLQLAFAAACKSVRAAEAFARAGVPHVIGSRTDVRDTTARFFSAVFYGCLLRDNMTITDAFDRASMSTSIQIKTESPFVLLGRGTEPLSEAAMEPNRHHVHRVRVFADAQPGAWIDVTPPPPPAVYPSPPGQWFGRELLVRTLQRELRTQRCVCLHSVPEQRGMGLSTVCAQMCRYMHRRRRPVGGGVVYVDLRRRKRLQRSASEMPEADTGNHPPSLAAAPHGQPYHHHAAAMTDGFDADDFDHPAAASASASAFRGAADSGIPDARQPSFSESVGFGSTAVSDSTGPLWQWVWRAAKKAIRAGGADLSCLAVPRSTTEMFKAVRKNLPNALFVLDGVDAMPSAKELAAMSGGVGAEESWVPSARQASSVAAASRGEPGGATGPARPSFRQAAAAALPSAGPQEDDDDDDDDEIIQHDHVPAGTAPRPSPATDLLSPPHCPPSREPSDATSDGGAAESEGGPEASSVSSSGRDSAKAPAPDGPAQAAAVAWRIAKSASAPRIDASGAKGQPQEERDAATLADDEDEDAGATMAAESAGGVLEGGHHRRAGHGYTHTSPGRPGHSRPGAALSPARDMIHRARTLPTARQRSAGSAAGFGASGAGAGGANGASPGTLEEARAFIGRLLEEVPGSVVLYSTCRQPLAPQVPGSATERVVDLQPLTHANAGALFISKMPRVHGSTTQLGVSAEEFRAAMNHAGLAVHQRHAWLQACNRRPGVLTRLAELIAMEGHLYFHHAVGRTSSDAKRRMLHRAMRMEEPLTTLTDVSTGDTATSPPALEAVRSTGSDGGEDDGVQLLEEDPAALDSATSAMSQPGTGAGADIFFGPVLYRSSSVRRSSSGIHLPARASPMGHAAPGGAAAPAAAASAAAAAAGADAAGVHSPPIERTDSQRLKEAFAAPPIEYLRATGAAFGSPASLDEQEPPPAAVPSAAASASSAVPRVADSRASWTVAGVLQQGNASLAPLGVELSAAGAQHWINMRLETAAMPGTVIGDALDPVHWSAVVSATRRLLAAAAPAGYESRGFGEGESEFLKSVLTRNKQPLPASEMLSLVQWAKILWPWLQQCTAVLGNDSELWALSSPALLYPFIDHTAASAMLRAAKQSGLGYAFVVRLSPALPLRVAVTYTAIAANGAISIKKVAISERGGVRSVPVLNEKPIAATSLADLVRGIPTWELVPEWVPTSGFVLASDEQPDGYFQYVHKSVALGALGGDDIDQDGYGDLDI